MRSGGGGAGRGPARAAFRFGTGRPGCWFAGQAGSGAVWFGAGGGGPVRFGGGSGRAVRFAVGQGAGRSGSRVGQGAIAGLCTGATAALVIAVLSTATIALLPHDTGLRDWAVGHVGQWTPGTPILGVRLGYVAGASAFAAGYLLVLVLGPLLGCGLGAWAASATGDSN